MSLNNESFGLKQGRISSSYLGLKKNQIDIPTLHAFKSCDIENHNLNRVKKVEICVARAINLNISIILIITSPNWRFHQSNRLWEVVAILPHLYAYQHNDKIRYRIFFFFLFLYIIGRRLTNFPVRILRSILFVPHGISIPQERRQ